MKISFNPFYPESLIMRRALSTAIAIAAAVFVNRYFSLLHVFWVPLTTILILQLSVRTSFRLMLQRFFVIMASVLAGTLIILYLHPSLLSFVVLIAIFIGCAFLHNLYPVKSSGFSPALMVGFIMLMMLVPFTPMDDILFARLHDVVLGGFIGMGAGLLLFPSRQDVDFRTGIVSVLKDYGEYLSAIADLFFQQENTALGADEKKAAVETTIQVRRAFFPDWVYEVGFNLNLREGHRHFLLCVEQLGEIIFAMHRQARHPIDLDLLNQVRQHVMRCIEDAKISITDVVTILEKADVKSIYSDFAGDVIELENSFNMNVVVPFELADTSADYMRVTGFIYAIKDLQRVLARMEESLRGYISRPVPN